MTALAPPADIEQQPAPLAPVAWLPITVIAVSSGAILLALSARYGIHRDEYYYLAGGRRLAWGFADHPPITPLLARWQADLFGTSVTAFRVIPSLIAGVAAIMTALVARELGGRRTAQVLAALAAALLPAIRGPLILFGTTATDQLFWAVLLLLAARMLRTLDPRWWIPIGAVAGIGLLNKHTVLFVLVLLCGGLLVTPQRRLLATRYAVIGGALALAIWAPNIWWQLTHGLPAKDMSSAIAEHNGGAVGGLPDFVLESIALWAFVGLVIGWWGWRWLTRSDAGEPWCALGYGTLLVIPLVALTGGKSYYVAPVAFVVAPAACVAIEADQARRRLAVAVLIVGGLISAPAVLPLLPPDRLNPVLEVNREFGEMIGWHDLAEQVAAVHRRLSPDEQRTAVIFTGDYSEAGSLQLYANELGLPPVYSGHNSYADWGTPAERATPVIIVGIDQQDLGWCTDLEPAGLITNDAGVDNDEAGQPLSICRGLDRTWVELWPALRHVD
jgi:hypothetical protein